jgi:hypothetical protein
MTSGQKATKITLLLKGCIGSFGSVVIIARGGSGRLFGVLVRVKRRTTLFESSVVTVETGQLRTDLFRPIPRSLEDAKISIERSYPSRMVKLGLSGNLSTGKKYGVRWMNEGTVLNLPRTKQTHTCIPGWPPSRPRSPPSLYLPNRQMPYAGS